ncbi:MAG: type II toxin-antitoxin system prevent-host-death family antitoxin [Proteobacteria bacterium]|nr:type II toxin-antitoxin system prevent-host-death family antitoxin [Pseudomonadota bacterium]MBI3497739.1 type II toxin-antitoxin system prevent-host-death family antitoxin [Pseudomonadota bacterium]
MAEVGVSKAKMLLARLLARVERGEEITITRHGRAIAWLVPAGQRHDVARAWAAAAGLRELAREMRLDRNDWSEWLGYRDKGRR